MELIELAHLAIGSPTQVALPGVSQVEMRDLLEAPGSVEARGNLVGYRFILNESVCVRRANGFFVEDFGVDQAAFYSCDFGSRQSNSVFKILRTMLRPYVELFVVSL